MKPLSNDLRERFVHAVLIEGMTCRAAGERFAVSHSAVIKIVRQFVETDAIDPQKVGGSRKPALVKCYDMVRAIVDETPDLSWPRSPTRSSRVADRRSANPPSTGR